MAFNKQVLLDDRQRYVIKVDGTSTDAAALLVDVSALLVPCNAVALESIIYDVLVGCAVELLWDATTDVSLFKMHGLSDDFCFDPPLPNNAGAGKTGDVMLTTTGTTVSYCFIASFKKRDLLQKA